MIYQNIAEWFGPAGTFFVCNKHTFCPTQIFKRMCYKHCVTKVNLICKLRQNLVFFSSEKQENVALECFN